MSKQEQALPFFARFLEGQFCEDLSEEEMETVQGGMQCPDHTLPKKDVIFTTLKYPSDNEEGGDLVTKKHPSDTDEFAVTQKYPSDGDDDIIAIDNIAVE
ncbi:MAG: microviridin/marinostatin family tricyclic proteinase inhibitor [Scytonema sp. PMC 1069.18]|nr:microviridin/marinostatin family tricyclic proteinase inhibitor [Scytonema sp. PMC 1069.18]MEC4880867.1 microviridin/marinostatin family tricyclic proteinase inhibitor [Scytonema sp. PMC 1070.18]